MDLDKLEREFAKMCSGKRSSVDLVSLVQSHDVLALVRVAKAAVEMITANDELLTHMRSKPLERLEMDRLMSIQHEAVRSLRNILQAVS